MGSMAVLLRIDVEPVESQVAIVDATWQGYPRWGAGDHWVAFRADSLVDPESPPYPGIAVATQPDIGPAGPQKVRVEVCRGEVPEGLRFVHRTVLYVGGHGVEVGNENRQLTRLSLRPGEHPLEVWVDGASPEHVSRVAFVLTAPED